MFEYWGFTEWFLVTWVIFYFITFLIVISKDKDIDNWLGESILCMFFWPLILPCMIIFREE